MTQPDPFGQRRADARDEILRTEDDIRTTFWAQLSNWLVQLSRRVLRGEGRRPDADEVWSMTGAWREAVDLVIERAILPAMRRAYQAIMGDGFDLESRPFFSAYLGEVRNRMARTPEEVYDLIAGQISEGVNSGESIPRLAERIEQTLSATATDRWENRATTVARTECLPGDALVNGAYATAAYRRWYSGPMVTIKTMGGREFTGTPNHPVLTTHGWAGLGQLLEGDRLLCDSGRIEQLGAPGDEDVQAGPSSIAEVFDALKAVGVARRERTAQPDFHGDRPEGDVDILGSFGVLPLGRFAKIEERSIDGILTPSELRQVALACERAPFARGDSIDQAPGLLRVAPCNASSEHDPLDRVDVAKSVGVDQRPGGLPGSVAVDDLPLRQIAPEHRVLAAVAIEVLSGIAERALDATLQDFRAHAILRESGLGCDPPVAEPGQVELDDVVSVEVREWSGHVFNLTTINGYFVSGGVYTGNTIGALNAAKLEAFKAYRDEWGEDDLMKVWISTDDARTRPTHVLADGQRVPLDEPFIVGGARLQFPGDPFGPADETINCRCGLLLVNADERVDYSDRQMRR